MPDLVQMRLFFFGEPLDLETHQQIVERHPVQPVELRPGELTGADPIARRSIVGAPGLGEGPCGPHGKKKRVGFASPTAGRTVAYARCLSKYSAVPSRETQGRSASADTFGLLQRLDQGQIRLRTRRIGPDPQALARMIERLIELALAPEGGSEVVVRVSIPS